LHVYPIKGCRGIDVAAADVATTGLAFSGVGDRECMVVDDTGRFLTQRELPRLALVSVAIGERALRLAAPYMRDCDVPIDAPGPVRDVVVWRSEVKGIDAGDAAAAWLSDWLARDVRLVRFDRRMTRPCNREYAGDSGAHTMFADGYPVLVVAKASLDDLNARLAGRGHAPLPMNRFRPNVVLDGLPAYAEDHLETIAAGDVELRVVKPCTRCQVTTTDQDTAKVGIEPLRTLGEYRMDTRLAGIAFATNAIVVRGGSLARSDAVSVEYRFD
jgi:uncharacterized protein YcbX